MDIYSEEKLKIYTIYKATNLINGKVYIGFDSKWPNRRNNHKNNYTKPNNLCFYNAIKKYKWDNFEWEVIYQSKDKEHCLSEMEPYFIKEYNSYYKNENSNGYNMTKGGEGIFGYKHKPNSIKKGEESPNYGKPRDKEIRDKIGKSSLNRNAKIHQFIDPNGQIVEIFNLQKFCKENNLSYSKMTEVRYGSIKHHKGYRNINNYEFIPKIITKKINEFKFLYFDTIIVIENLSKFCKENNLEYEKMYRVHTGNRKSYQNYFKFQQ